MSIYLHFVSLYTSYYNYISYYIDNLKGYFYYEMFYLTPKTKVIIVHKNNN